MKSYRKLALLLAFILMFAFSCAEKHEEESSSGDREAVAARKTIRVLMSAENPPFEYFDKDGELKGADIDLAWEVAAVFHAEPEFITMNFADLEDALKSGEGDIIISAYPDTYVRDEALLTTDIYYRNALFALVDPDGDIKSEEDLQGKVIAVQENSQANFYAEDIIKAKYVDKYEYIADAVGKLKDGSVDAILLDKATAAVLDSENGDISRIYIGGYSENYVIIVRSGSDLISRVNAVVAQFNSTQEYQDLIIAYAYRPAADEGEASDDNG